MIKKLVGLLLLASVSFAGQYQSKRYFENNGGLYDHISPLLVPDKNSSSMQNITLDDRGQLSKRNGYDMINSSTAFIFQPVIGGGYQADNTGNSFFVVVSGTSAYRTTNSFGGTFTNVIGSVTVTNAASNLAQATSLANSLVFCNESDPMFKVGLSGNAITISNGLSKAHTCTTYGNYLIVGNTTESAVNFTSRIRWSDINNVDTFPANNYLDVEPDDGDKIVSIVAYADSVYIFKKHTVYLMQITGSAGADAFIIRPLSRGIGAWAKNSVIAIPGVGINFLAQNTVYNFDGANFTPIGDTIQRTLDSVNRTMWVNAVAAHYPKRYQYWLSVSTGGTTNDNVLIYDYVQKAWTVYTNINANMLSEAEDSTGANILLHGDNFGDIYKEDTGTFDRLRGSSITISSAYTTANLTMDGPEFRKNFKYLYLFTKTDTSTTLVVDAFYDFGDTSENQNSVSVGTTGAVYDTALYDIDVYPGTSYATNRFELNRSAKAIRLKFSNRDGTGGLGLIGWVIVYSLEDYTQ